MSASTDQQELAEALVRFGVAARKMWLRRVAREWAMAVDDIPPCKFCGRVMLAGVCCDARLNNPNEE